MTVGALGAVLPYRDYAVGAALAVFDTFKAISHAVPSCAAGWFVCVISHAEVDVTTSILFML